MPKCDACGRYARRKPGSSWARRYSGWPPEPSREAFWCKTCTTKRGPLPVQSGMQPWTAGVIKETPDAG
mgnify:CR=1 FL=1